MLSSSKQIWLAPLRGYTDAIFRNNFSALYDGIDGAIAPFVTTVRGNKIKASHLKDLMPENNHGVPVVPQILSKSASHFIALARELHQLGYAVINWNLGCPYPMVAKKERGSGLLPHPEKVIAFLEEVMANIPNRMSIKMRLGYISKNEIAALLPLLNLYPLEELIIHPRTGKQMYEGRPDETAFGECLSLTSHSVVYNGDIRTVEDYERLQRKFPTINKWMIGRGILADPLLPMKIRKRPVDKTSAFGKFRIFHDRLCKDYAQLLSGPGHLLNRMKGFWRYFASSFTKGPQILKKIQRCKHLEAYQAYVDSLFDLEMKCG